MLFYCFMFIAMSMSVNAFDYCSINCEGVVNTMCAYPSGGGGSCREYQKGLTPGEREILLTEHNTHRQRVALGQEMRGPQPPAADMMELAWDDELEAIAQRWMEQCSSQEFHDSCRKTSDGNDVGQNIMTSWGSGNVHFDKEAALRSAVQGWYDEAPLFSPSLVNSFSILSNFKETGHYSQLVWSRTTRVGCGISYLANEQGYRYKIGCNYKPGGNMRTRPVYKVGQACTACPVGTVCSTKYQGLCSAR